VITKIISGGQTGTDFGALLAAQEYNIPTGGWCPQGWMTESGPSPHLADFGLVEAAPGWKDRTQRNVRDSDGTLLVSPVYMSPGSVKTRKCCSMLGKPWFATQSEPDPGEAKRVAAWILLNHIYILNVAGNRESVSPGVQELSRRFVGEVIHLLMKGEANEEQSSQMVAGSSNPGATESQG